MTENGSFEIECKKYLQKHSIHSLFENLLVELATEKPDDPLEFMKQRLQESKPSMKICVIGCPGAGVSKLTQWLAKKYDLSVGTNENDFERRVVMDQFPKTRLDALKMQEKGHYPDFVLHLTCRRDVSRQRRGVVDGEDDVARDEYETNIAEVLETFHSNVFELDTSDLPEILVYSKVYDFIEGRNPKAPSITLVGMSGSGKSTVAYELGKRLNAVVINPRREAIHEINLQTPLGEKLRPSIENNTVLPPDSVIELILDRIQQADVKTRGYILDGFPQSGSELSKLTSFGICPSLICILQGSGYEDRLSGRLIDPLTGVVYHENNIPRGTNKQNLIPHQRNATLEKNMNQQTEALISTLNNLYAELLYTLDSKQPVDLLVHSIINKFVGESPTAKKYFILGGVFSGKKSMAKALSSRMGLVSVNVDELIQEERSTGSNIGKAILEAEKNDTPVSDVIISKLMTRRLRQPDCLRKGWVVAGYPATIVQAKQLLESSILPTAIINLEVSTAIALKRASMIQQDPVTKEFYHTQNNPASVEIAKRLIQPYSDAYVKNSLFSYLEQILDIQSVWKGYSSIVKVSADEPLNKVQEDAFELLK